MTKSDLIDLELDILAETDKAAINALLAEHGVRPGRSRPPAQVPLG